MAEEVRNKAEYFIAFINEFGKANKLSDTQAYRYLRRYKGVEMIDRFYEVAHTQSFKDMVADVAAYCRRQGGKL
ncbi:MAG: DUF3791 domain-containing protein [Bacteroidaceae bacterium]|nr:DUF3791 domain-containing protein [Bacteroidaceae bacterium]